MIGYTFKNVNMIKLLLIFIILHTAVFCADTLFVSKTGSSTPPFSSWSTAATKIQLAVDAASDDDVILIGRGTFIEKVFVNKELKFIGLDRDSSIVDCTELSHIDSFDFTFELEADCEFYNLTFVNGYSDGKFDFNIFSVDKDITVKDCNFFKGVAIGMFESHLMVDNSKISNAYIGLDLWSSSSDTNEFKITNCQIHATNAGISTHGGIYIIKNNIFSGVPQASFAVSHMYSYTSMEFENNIVTDIKRVCIDDNHHLGESIVRNNIFYNCTEENGFYFVIDIVYPFRKKFENNIIYNCAAAVKYTNQDSFYVQNNLYSDVKRKFVGSAGHKGKHVDEDPMFVNLQDNPLESDFRLQKYSPAINAGNPDILDLDGSISDIGPLGGPGGEQYEYLDLPPGIPEIEYFAFDTTTHKLEIEWSPDSSSSDFSHFEVHKGIIEDFAILTNTAFIKTTDTTYSVTLPDISDSTLFYKVVSVDAQGNKSECSEVLKVVLIEKVVKVESINYRRYELKQNYPNPFNPETRISYQLKEASNVLIEILDIKGERIEILAKGKQSAGEHSVIFNASNLASGIYIYRLQVADKKGKSIYSQSNKMVLLK
ncbi:MAG: hypothetical protein SCALA702_01590 [Melioribacteraceae bacterium]|nr:MAG: hypothetical protein SCALA702_01590 [Melioribacteraceae bacterium]